MQNFQLNLANFLQMLKLGTHFDHLYLKLIIVSISLSQNDNGRGVAHSFSQAIICGNHFGHDSIMSENEGISNGVITPK